jgi:hypothetical protein
VIHLNSGEIQRATFLDRGPDQPIRSARHFTGSEEVRYHDYTAEFKAKEIFVIIIQDFISLLYMNFKQKSLKKGKFKVAVVTGLQNLQDVKLSARAVHLLQ